MFGGYKKRTAKGMCHIGKGGIMDRIPGFTQMLEQVSVEQSVIRKRPEGLKAKSCILKTLGSWNY